MMPRQILALFAVVLLAGATFSCRQGDSTSRAQGALKSGPQTFQAKGVIQELLADESKVRIAHQEIPGYMKAMTMVFDVKDARELAGLQPGDSVSFRLRVTEDDGWIDHLKKLEAPRTPLPSAPANFRRRSRAMEMLRGATMRHAVRIMNRMMPIRKANKPSVSAGKSVRP